MLTNWDLFTISNTIKNRDAEGKDLRVSEFQSLINAQSQLLFAEKLGLPNTTQSNAPITRQGAEINRAIDQSLLPFFTRETVGVTGGSVDVSGKGIGYLSAVEPTTITGRGFDELSPSEVADRVADPITAPTTSDPALEWVDDENFLVYPSSITQVVLKYYKYPSDAVIETTVNTTTLLEEYDSGNSTELEWNDVEKIEILYRALRDIGLNANRQDITQYAQSIVANE